MLESLFVPHRVSAFADPALPGALERASAAIARLDWALSSHPLQPAFLYRARLEAVRRQAEADGYGTDLWHLAATLEGLRLRIRDGLSIAERCAVLEAPRAALGLHQWLTAPDYEMEKQIQDAERALDKRTSTGILISAAGQFHAWLDAGGARAPMRAALIRYWVKHQLFRLPVPLTGPKALSAEAPERVSEWVCAFLHALTDEAEDYHQLLIAMEREWFSARHHVAGRHRSNSRAPMAIDVMAAAPLISATTLASAIGISIKSATVTLDEFMAEWIAVEVTHRSARRLFGLKGLAPLREETARPRRSIPGPGRGRPRRLIEVNEEDPVPPARLPPITPIERKAFDYTELEAVLAHLDPVNRSAKRALDGIARSSR